MKRFLSLTMCLVMAAAAGTAFAADKSTSVDVSELNVVIDGQGVLQTSTTSSQSLLMREAAGPDTFDLYGGAQNLVRDPDGIPGSGDEYVEGKFQDVTGFTPRGLRTVASPGANQWFGVDLTDQPTYFQVSDFNAENLNGNGSGNEAAWSGLADGDPLAAGWDDAPGYGNNWNDVLLFESDPVANPAAGASIGLDFYYNIDLEPGYDFFLVEYDSAGTWTTVWQDDNTNRTELGFPIPGLQYSTLAASPIVFTGGDYGEGDRVRIRMVVTSDGGFSDEDGLYVGDGAVQIDDIAVTGIPGQSYPTETFTGGFVNWAPDKAAFAGDFAKVFAGITDIDPCADNNSPMVGFIDDGTAPSNGPGVDGTVATGGSLSINWDYGIPGGYVFNYTGGLTGGAVPVNNEVWSPEFDWDVPGVADDGVDVSGSALYFTVWRHNPLNNGTFYVWHVRSQVAGEWGTWQDRGFVYFSATGEYLPTLQATTDLIPQGVEKVQVALGGTDLADSFGFPGTDSTPAPLFDSVRFYKYKIGGIPISTRTIDLSNDSFPTSGDIAASNDTERDLLDIRFDEASDISSGDANVPGDSIAVTVAPVIPGTTLDRIDLKWALRRNPLFDAVRTNPPVFTEATTLSITDFAASGDVWTGTVAADSARTAANNSIVDDVFFADLPDFNFLYPGDLLHYYFEAEDNDGRITTLPGNTDGFGVWDADGQSDYSRTYTVRCLPSIVDDGSGGTTQPAILVYNDFGRRGGEAEFTSAFNQLGLKEGRDWDSYTTQGPSSGVSNGLGSAGEPNSLAIGSRRGHGANQNQLGGYDTIIYLSGNLNSQLLSDGSDGAGGFSNDKSPDLATLTAWKELSGARNTAYFGDFIGSAVATDSPGEGGTYLSTVMSITVNGIDVRDNIGGQTAPVVRPTGDVVGFSTEFIAYGGCFGINQFDDISALAPALRSHGFVNPNTDGIYDTVAAGVVHDRLVGGVSRKVDITFPFGDLYIQDNISRALPGSSARTLLLEEILAYFNTTAPNLGDATAAPDRRPASFSLYPNPFNPKTAINFALPAAGVKATVKVYNVRGELVRTLHDGLSATADLALEWNGEDNNGGRVASGVYLVKAVTEGFNQTKKAVLVK